MFSQTKKDSLFNKYLLEQLNIHKQKTKMNFDVNLTPYTKISWKKSNWKWIKDLDVRVNTVKPLEENIYVNLHDLELGSAFLCVTSKA